jgi:DNA invertase Pin-like site-specific DNA recombinase
MIGGFEMKIAYVRVSTIEQNEARQVEALKKFEIEKWFTEKVSAKDTNRPQLMSMLEFAREGDTIYVHDFSRLARSTSDLLKVVEKLNEKKINLTSVKENIDSTTPTGKLMLTMIGAINEFERANLLERQREGIAIAKKEGVYKGRKPITFSNDAFLPKYSKYMARQITKTDFAKDLGISRPTLDKILKDDDELRRLLQDNIRIDWEE